MVYLWTLIMTEPVVSEAWSERTCTYKIGIPSLNRGVWIIVVHESGVNF